MFKTYMSASAGTGSMAAPVSSPGGAGPGGWHPTVLYMFGLTLAEIVAVAFLSRHLLR